MMNEVIAKFNDYLIASNKPPLRNPCPRCINELLYDECEICDNDYDIELNVLMKAFEIGKVYLFREVCNIIQIPNINEKLLFEYLTGRFRCVRCHPLFPHVFDSDFKCSQKNCNFPNCCNDIQDIIDLGVDLSYTTTTTFIGKANAYDITILIKNGADINQIFDKDQTIISKECYKILNGSNTNRFEFLLKHGANLNVGNLWRQISGIQYNDTRVSFIKYLIKLGIDCTNRIIFKDRKLYDTRVGLVIVRELYGSLFEEDGSSLMIENPDAYRVLLNNMD